MRAAMRTLLGRLPLPPSTQPQAAQRAAALHAQLEGARVERAAISSRLRVNQTAGRTALAEMVERLVAEHRATLPPADQRRATLPLPLPPQGERDHRRQRRILRTVGRLDRLSGAEDRLLEVLLAPLVAPPKAGPLRVLDLHGGHGDGVVGLLRWAGRQGLAVEVTVAEDRPGMVAHLCARLQAEGQPQPRTTVVDLQAPQLARRSFDLVVMHRLGARLSPGALGVLFWEATQAAGRGVLWIEGWRAVERWMLGSLLAGHPSGVQAVLCGEGGALTPEEMRLVTAGCLGAVQVEAVPPGLIGARWLR